MQHNIIFFMSLSGSVVFLLYQVLNPVLRIYTSVKFRYRILKMALVFYLFPFAYFSNLLRSFLAPMFPLVERTISVSPQSINYFNPIVVGSFVQVPFNVWIVWGAVSCSGLFSFSIIGMQLLQYRKTKKRRLGQGTSVALEEQRRRMLKVQQEIGLRRNVAFIFSMYEQMPMAVGVLSPTIVLPMLDEEELETEVWSSILRHELIHIRNRDLLCNFIALTVMAVHWFNPLCYLLFRELGTLGEMACDADVLEGQADEYRKEYSNLLIDLSESGDLAPDDNYFISMGLANNEKSTLKRRILEMKQEKKVKRGLSLLIGMAMCILGVMPAFAYSAPAVVRVSNAVVVPLDSGTTDLFLSGSPETLDGYSAFERYFIDEQGNTYKCENIQERSPCFHSMVTGSYVDHNIFSDGGCEKIYYHAERCKYCGYTEVGEYYKTVTLRVCAD